MNADAQACGMLSTIRKGTADADAKHAAYWAPSGKERGMQHTGHPPERNADAKHADADAKHAACGILGTLRKGTADADAKHAAYWAPSVKELQTRTHKQLQTRTHKRAAYWAHSVVKELQMHAAYSLGTLQEGTADADAACTRLPSLTT